MNVSLFIRVQVPAMVSVAIEIVRAPLKIMFFHNFFPWSGWLVLTFFLLKPDPPNLRSGAKSSF